jgi:2-keto-3-deoxy-L-arabinonate dehydratase
MDAPLTGVVPVVPTIFHDDEAVDLAGTVRVVDYLVDAGVDGLCLLANYSEQFSLTDGERDAIAVTLLEHVAGRLPVIVTTSHYSARVAAARSRAAQDMGAAMVMLMPPFFGATLTVPGPAVIEYFKHVTDGIDIPVMVQDAPLSPTPLPASLLIDLVRQVPQVQYAKIEVPQAADKLHSLVSALGDSLPGPFDGEESVTLIPDLDAGAKGTMPSSMVPAELGRIVRRYLSGDRPGAVSAWEDLLPLIHFENRQCGLRAQKILLAESGITDSDRTRAPLRPVPPRTRRGLLELAAARDLLITRWARLTCSEGGEAMQPMPEDWATAVAVVAHPDDLEYGVASAIARWTGQGKKITYLLATRGEAGIAGMAPAVTGPLREDEERRSAAVVGVSDVEFLGHQDGLVEYGIPLRRDLAAAFRRVQPEVVITMSFELTWGEDGPVNHADHRAVGLAVLDACRDAANEWVFPDAGPPCRTIKDAYVATSGNATHFVDVTGTIDAGVASLREHRAYLDGLGGDFDPDEFLRNMAGYVGLAAGCEYALGLRRYSMG